MISWAWNRQVLMSFLSYVTLSGHTIHSSQLTRRHMINDTAHTGMQTNDKTLFLVKLLSIMCKTQATEMSPASSAIFLCSLPIQSVPSL